MNIPELFTVFIVSALACFTPAAAQQVQTDRPSSSGQTVDEAGTFGGWHFIEVNHDFTGAKMYATLYMEHDNLNYNRFDCTYARLSVGFKPLSWLKAGVNYVPVYADGCWKHHIEADVTGTLASGGFKVSVRERYRRGLSSPSDELRSKLKVAYHLPRTGFTPYLAAEVFTWGTQWKKTRHYVACTYAVTEFLDLEWYYMYYAFRDTAAEHVIGFGLDFDF